ncbi:tyrosine-type recombinase/integrase [Sphingomonas sp. ZB1N12]
MRRATSLQVALDRYPLVDEWLQLLGNLGRSPATLDAYGRGVIHYLAYCTSSSVAAEAATLEDVSLYVRDLLPDGSAAVANSTLHQRLTAIRLWYDHLIFQGLCSKNPVPRGQTSTFRRIPDHAGFSRGLVARLIKLPHVPTEDEWLSILRAAASDTVRNRLMLAFAYYGALRRCELVALRIGDLDFAHRLITLRAETTKGKRSRVVCYSPVITSVLARHLQDSRSVTVDAGPLFRSVSDRNHGQPLTKWSWSKTVERWATAAGVSDFSTHSLRHLRLTHLARSGWKLHELSTYAGHRDPKTTVAYLHLSGSDLSARMAGSVAHIDTRIGSQLFGGE